MKNPLWSKALKSCADPHRAKHCLDQLTATDARIFLEKASGEQARILAALFSGSQALSEILAANPDWLSSLTPEILKHPRREQGMRREINSSLKPIVETRDYVAGFNQIRRFKQREMLRIAARDLARLAFAPEITREISDLADVCLDSVWQFCWLQFTGRFGTPFHQDAGKRWQPTKVCIFGLGKLGGQELNYSSDVDVIFVYADEGCVFKEPPKAKSTSSGLTNHQFFNRLAKAFIEEVTRPTPHGFLYRIDLRLRPEGDAGPLIRSLSSCENYYAQWGQTWERMMLIKARRVAGDADLAFEFLEMIQPFRYPRSLGEDFLCEVAAMKDRIENEILKADELERNVKLGRGGIREIEFIAQALQLLHAGRQPFLQGAQTLSTLEKLVQYHLLASSDARALTEAYCFLRDVEHRLQMENNLQTHTIPQDRKSQERLAKLMCFGTLNEFEFARQNRTRFVRQSFEKLLRIEAQQTPDKNQTALPTAFEGVASEAEWKQVLTEHSFRDADKAVQLFKEFAEGPGFVHVSARTVELARQLIPKFLSFCPAQSRTKDQKSEILSDPDRVLTRLDSFITAYGARATLFDSWNRNPAIFELLLFLFDRSEFLAEIAIRTPDLVDSLMESGHLRRSKTAAETLRELRHGVADEDQLLWLRRYHQAEFMRIGLRDILGLLDTDEAFGELTALADACLQYALEIVTRKNKLPDAPFAIIGLGKLGGAELDYGSDLDIIFIADNKVKNLARLQPMAAEVMELLSKPTELGIAFHTDARLRPDGASGLLVNTLTACEEYYRQRAQLWEIQAISRTRPVAGDPTLGEQFQKLAAKLANFKQPNPSLAAYAADWKQQIHKMRMRVEKERTPAGKDELAIKTGTGGLMDAEFIAQVLCMENGWQEANTMRALERGRDAKVLPNAEKLIKNFGELRRLERILRRWSFEGETVLPDDPAPFYRVSVRCGFQTPQEFRDAVADWRRAIREVYAKVFGIK